MNNREKHQSLDESKIGKHPSTDEQGSNNTSNQHLINVGDYDTGSGELNPAHENPVHINEAIAFQTLIDSNIGEKLHNLFHDNNHQFNLSSPNEFRQVTPPLGSQHQMISTNYNNTSEFHGPPDMPIVFHSDTRHTQQPIPSEQILLSQRFQQTQQQNLRQNLISPALNYQINNEFHHFQIPAPAQPISRETALPTQHPVTQIQRIYAGVNMPYPMLANNPNMNFSFGSQPYQQVLPTSGFMNIQGHNVTNQSMITSTSNHNFQSIVGESHLQIPPVSFSSANERLTSTQGEALSITPIGNPYMISGNLETSGKASTGSKLATSSFPDLEYKDPQISVSSERLPDKPSSNSQTVENELLNDPRTIAYTSDSNTDFTGKKQTKNRNPRGGTCTICDKYIKRDLARHLRIHEEILRFRCIYPRQHCPHKSGYFNRKYDFKKHLLHFHFTFDESNVKRLHSLSEKLSYMGTCPCGRRFNGGQWLDDHILTDDKGQMCPSLVTQLQEAELAQTLEFNEEMKST